MREMLGRMRKHFDAQEEIREKAFGLSRQVIRASARAIAAMHRDDNATAKKMLEEARVGLVKLENVVKPDPVWMESGTVQSAQQEYCEAKLFEGVRRGRLSTADELNMPYEPYLGGMADVSGELRRRALDMIRADKIVDAEKALKMMEEIHEFLMSFDYPDAILPGMKRKQDMVRGVLEKTRGDLTIALRHQKLERALERARKR